VEERQGWVVTVVVVSATNVDVEDIEKVQTLRVGREPNACFAVSIELALP